MLLSNLTVHFLYLEKTGIMRLKIGEMSSAARSHDEVGIPSALQ